MKDIPTTINKGRIFEGILFASNLDRNRYVGTVTKARPRWLQDNPDKWTHLPDIPQTAAPPLKPETDVSATEATMPFPDSRSERNDEDTSGSVKTPASASSPAEHMPSTVAPATAALSPSEIAKTKIAIEGDVHVSTPCFASMLGVSERTLSRLLANGNGPPHVRITGNYYPLDKIQEWAAARGLLIKPLVNQ
jgi:DNA-binding transcriptional regulator YiaG